MEKKNVFRADLHMHTHHSKDSLSKPLDILKAAMRKGLHAIAITDHDEIDGAFEAAKLAKAMRLPLQVIIGEEVATAEGDLLVYFLKKRIARGNLATVLAEVKRQGAICCAAHPYDFTRYGIALEKIPAKQLAAIDAIEAFNARITVRSHNSDALKFAHSRGKPILAGSDAHHPAEVGAAYVEFSGVKKLDKHSLLSAPRTLGGKVSPAYVHLFSRYAVAVKKARKVFRR
jgi:hypothetical protein